MLHANSVVVIKYNVKIIISFEHIDKVRICRGIDEKNVFQTAGITELKNSGFAKNTKSPTTTTNRK